jgi:hypothetical protein
VEIENVLRELRRQRKQLDQAIRALEILKQRGRKRKARRGGSPARTLVRHISQGEVSMKIIRFPKLRRSGS